MAFLRRRLESVEQISDAPATYLVRIPSPAVVSGATNCYVILDGDQQLMVDVGPLTREGVRIWRRVREELGLRPDRLKVFLTHLHDDHAGLIRELELDDAPVLVPRANKADFDYRFEPDHYAQARQRWVREAFPIIDQRAMRFYGPAYYTELPRNLNVQLVDAGETVQVGRAAFQVVDTSGHTPGHSSLYHAESGMLLAGDHILFDITPVLEACAYEPDILGVYLQNLRKVRDMDVSLHCHAHGLLQPPGAHCERADALEAREMRRVERAFDVVEHRPGVTGYGIIVRMGWRTGSVMWDELGIDLRNCILHNGMAILDHLLATGDICREPDALGEYRYFLA